MNRLKKINLLITLSLSMAGIAQASGEKGNGGDALVCLSPTGEIQSVEFFDPYEAREKYKKKVNLGDASLSVDQKLRMIEDRMKTMFPKLSRGLRNHAATFLDLALFTNTHLVDIQDSGSVRFPENCHIEQAIIRGPVANVVGKNFLVDENLWNRMDADSRVAAIVHEYFYGLAVDIYRHENSVSARRLNAEFLADPDPSLESPLDWCLFFNSLGLGFDEPWGTNRGYGKSQSDSEFEWFQGTLGAPMVMRSTRLGTIRLGSGPYRIWRNTKNGESFINGILADTHVFSTDLGDWTVSAGGHFEEMGDTGYPYHELRPELSIGGKEILVPPLPSVPGQIKLSRDCRIFEGSVFFNLTFKGRLEPSIPMNTARINVRLKAKDRNCVVQYEVPSQSLSMESAGDLNFDLSPKSPNDVAGFSVTAVPTHLKWPYGEFQGFRGGVAVSKDYVFSSSEETIALIPDLVIGTSHLLDVSLASMWFSDDMRPHSFKMSKNSPDVTVIIRDGVRIKGRFSSTNVLNGVEGDFVITELRGFSSDYIGLPVESFVDLQIVLKELPKAHVTPAAWIKSFNNNPSLPFDQTYQRELGSSMGERKKFVVPFFKEGKVAIAGSDGKNEIRVPIMPNWGASVQLTLKGMLHYRKKELQSFRYSAFLRPDGFFLDEIWEPSPL